MRIQNAEVRMQKLTLLDSTILHSDFCILNSYFQSLNKLSKARRAASGVDATPVDVCFSTRTLIEKNLQSLRTSFFAIRSGTGCMHSKRFEGSK